MLLHLSLQNFRNYKKSSFEFEKSVIIIGPNTSGKSNLIEGVFLLSTGKSFRAEKDLQMVAYNHELGRVRGSTEETSLEVVVTVGEVSGVTTQFKRFFVNGVAKRRADFVGNLPAVLFTPQDLEIIVGSPGLRRNFLDNVLEQTDRDYRIALLGFTKALRQRNALLELVKNRRESRRPGGPLAQREFEYWDNLVIRNGNVLTRKREVFIEYLNQAKKEILDTEVIYDRSEISRERLDQYKDAETASGVTLVGPHRDDFIVHFNKGGSSIQSYGVAADKAIIGEIEQREIFSSKERASQSDATWNFQEKLNELITQTERRDLHLIGLYWQHKGFNFSNSLQFQVSLKRDLLAAKVLVGYSDDDIIATMDWLFQKTEIKFTLETVHKYIDEDLNRIKSFKKYGQVSV